MTFDSTFTNNSNNDTTSLRKKMVVGGAIALLLGVATYSSNGASNVGDKHLKMRVKNLLRSTQGTATETDVGFACSTIENQVDGVIANINQELAALENPLTLEQDTVVFQKEDVPLDDKGCRGDITITVAQGASVSGLSDTTIKFTEQECQLSWRGSLKGTWELSSSSSAYDVEATVTTKATNCEIDTSGSVTITVQQPTSSATASVKAGVYLIGGPSAVIEEVKLDEVVVGFDEAFVKITPSDGHSYAPAEAAAITKAINKNLVPQVNAFIAKRNPTTITPADVNTPENASKFIKEWFLKGHMDGTYIYK